LVIHKRDEWGARPIKDNHEMQDPARILEVFIHHSASFGRPIDTVGEQRSAMRAMQRFHQDDRGWADIAYHYVVFQPYGTMRRARIYEGRPLSVVPAAQLGHNVGTCAICIVQADPERLKLNTRWRVGRLARRIESPRRLRGHYEVSPTECPGAVIRAQLGTIARIAGLSR
jgi:hypothetical protein